MDISIYKNKSCLVDFSVSCGYVICRIAEWHPFRLNVGEKYFDLSLLGDGYLF